MVLNNVILSTLIVCMVLVIINKYMFIILHGHTMKLLLFIRQLITSSVSPFLKLQHCTVEVFKEIRFIRTLPHAAQQNTTVQTAC